MPVATVGEATVTCGLLTETAVVPKETEGVPMETEGVPTETEGVPILTEGVPIEISRVSTNKLREVLWLFERYILDFGLAAFPLFHNLPK